MSNKIGNIKPSNNNSGWCTQPGSALGNTKPKGDIHDTFQTNKSGDLLTGHTTVNIGSNIKARIDWK